jgi:hypothetical protein
MQGGDPAVQQGPPEGEPVFRRGGSFIGTVRY